jgi:putative inorganic carbon (HCO3(-)) transporter
MKSLIRNNLFVSSGSLFFLIISSMLIWFDFYWLCLFPLILLGIYSAIFHSKFIFLSLAFLTPLSVNIEEFTESVGLFLPTEPFFFGFMLLVIFFELRKRTFSKKTLNHPIVLAAGFYLLIVLISAVTSSNPVVSFKFLLAKLWFFIPMLLLGPVYFKQDKNIVVFIFLFVLATVIASVYSLIHHSIYDFGEKEGHWVMYPFFKDHTIYGAILALVLPWSIALFFIKKNNLLQNIVNSLIVIIILVALFFSYTRAAWISVIGSFFILVLIYFRIKLIYLLTIGFLAIGSTFIFWDQIQMELERNNEEHTTEEFGNRLQSAANVSTDASNLERINRWSCAIEMFKERPLLGFGPGTYQFEYAQFQQPENLTIISTNFGDMGNAHSEYLGALSETGIFGLLALLILIIIIYYKGIILSYKSKGNRAQQAILLTSIIGISTYIIHAFFNNYLDTDKAAVPILGICAMIIAIDNRTKNNVDYNKSISEE